MNVYVIEADNGHVKIGISRNPQNRLDQLQTATSLQLSLAHIEQTERASEVERATHAALASKRLIGEWFNASVAEAVQAIKDCLSTLPPKFHPSPTKAEGEPIYTAPISNLQHSIDTVELEQAAVAFFRAIRAMGKECLGHEQFGFKVDINTMSPPHDKNAAILFGTKIQDALTLASRTVQPVTIEGTTLQ